MAGTIHWLPASFFQPPSQSRKRDDFACFAVYCSEATEGCVIALRLPAGQEIREKLQEKLRAFGQKYKQFPRAACHNCSINYLKFLRASASKTPKLRSIILYKLSDFVHPPATSASNKCCETKGTRTQAKN